MNVATVALSVASVSYTMNCVPWPAFAMNMPPGRSRVSNPSLS
jgi:hypothetical protein